MKFLLLTICLSHSAISIAQSKKEQIKQLNQVIHEQRVEKQQLVLRAQIQEKELANKDKELDSLELTADLLRNKVRLLNRELENCKKYKEICYDERDSLKKVVEKLKYPYGRKKKEANLFTFGGSSGNGGSGTGDIGKGVGHSDGIKIISKPSFKRVKVSEFKSLSYMVSIDREGNVVKTKPLPYEINTTDAGFVLKIGRMIEKDLKYSNPKGLVVTKKYTVYFDKDRY